MRSVGAFLKLCIMFRENFEFGQSISCRLFESLMESLKNSVRPLFTVISVISGVRTLVHLVVNFGKC